MDYTVIPKHIREMMDTLGCPLSEDQQVVLAGALAAIQDTIERDGLAHCIRGFEKHFAERQQEND